MAVPVFLLPPRTRRAANLRFSFDDPKAKSVTAQVFSYCPASPISAGTWRVLFGIGQGREGIPVELHVEAVRGELPRLPDVVDAHIAPTGRVGHVGEVASVGR